MTEDSKTLLEPIEMEVSRKSQDNSEFREFGRKNTTNNESKK